LIHNFYSRGEIFTISGYLQIDFFVRSRKVSREKCGWRLAAGGLRLVAGGLRLAACGWRLAAGGLRLAASE